jgi:hypothetical protein
MNSYSSLKSSHDLTLPDWGPYSKSLFGVSHLADPAAGARMDLSVVPGICRRPPALPDARVDSGYLPWETSDNLDYYSYRQQIEWKDQVYCDISFSKLADSARLVRCECVNHTDLPVPFCLQLLSMLHYPERQRLVMQVAEGVVWLDARDVIEVDYAVPDLRNGLARDGMRRGEEANGDCLNGSCLGQGFGTNCGDRMRFAVPEALRGQRLTVQLRYQVAEGGVQRLAVNGVEVVLTGTGEWHVADVFAGVPENDQLSIVGTGGEGMKLDGLILIPDGLDRTLVFERLPFNTAVSSQQGPIPNSRLIHFDSVEQGYGLWWSTEASFVRQFNVPDMMHLLRFVPGAAHSFKPDVWGQCEDGDHAVDTAIQPITVSPGGSQVVYAIICQASPESLAETLSNCVRATPDPEAIYEQARARRVCPAITPAGREYLFSQERMAAVTMTNVVYPIRAKGGYIRHHTPGRLWDSLYTWDSGFIGLGLLESSLQRAIENLNVYLTEPGDPETAFIDHGTWVPTQIYLYQEILNRHPEHADEVREFFYPRLRQYYRFFAGHAAHSVTRDRSKPGLLCTWDYNYNSGGWDDYPPQWQIHLNGKKHILPVIPSVHAIRCAKLLARSAKRLGLSEDAALYQNDIDTLTDALQRYSWDGAAGYFSYVVHSPDGVPQGVYRHESGANYNMGLDGAAPLISDSCTPEQSDILWSKLLSPEHCWTPYGLSSVDQSAPYFRRDGYWNGSIWMPYQWFFWKAALSAGKADIAWRIAKTGLDLWQQETQASYGCYEHFETSSGRGAGWHHFSALSTPVLAWFGAYFHQGVLTAGFDVEVLDLKRDADSLCAELCIEGSSGCFTTLIAVLGGEDAWQADYNGRSVAMRQRVPGTWELDLPNESQGKLRIRR